MCLRIGADAEESLLDVATAITISRGTVRKMHQNLAWAVGYNSLALVGTRGCGRARSLLGSARRGGTALSAPEPTTAGI